MKRAAVAAMVLVPGLVTADEVHLRGGGRIRGAVVERSASSIVVDTGPGRVTLPLSRVERVVVNESALQTFRKRRARLHAQDVQGWLTLAAWAEAHNLNTQARTAYEHVLRVAPDNAGAQQGLGRERISGRWMSHEHAQAARGLVLFEGEWMTRAERGAAVAARAEQELAKRVRAEADQRVREAEARARTAEARARQAEAEAQASSDSQGLPLWVGGGGTVVVGPSNTCTRGCGQQVRSRPAPRRPPQRSTRTPRRRTTGLVSGSSDKR